MPPKGKKKKAKGGAMSEADREAILARYATSSAPKKATQPDPDQPQLLESQDEAAPVEEPAAPPESLASVEESSVAAKARSIRPAALPSAPAGDHGATVALTLSVADEKRMLDLVLADEQQPLSSAAASSAVAADADVSSSGRLTEVRVLEMYAALVDTLTFEPSDAEDALRATRAVSLPAALDWLLLHVAHERVPTRFTDKASLEPGAITSIVLVPATTAPSAPVVNNDAGSSTPPPVLVSSPPTEPQNDDKVNAWIAEKYLYASSDEDEVSTAATTTAAASNTKSKKSKKKGKPKETSESAVASADLPDVDLELNLDSMFDSAAQQDTPTVTTIVQVDTSAAPALPALNLQAHDARPSALLRDFLSRSRAHTTTNTKLCETTESRHGRHCFTLTHDATTYTLDPPLFCASPGDAQELIATWTLFCLAGSTERADLRLGEPLRSLWRRWQSEVDAARTASAEQALAIRSDFAQSLLAQLKQQQQTQSSETNKVTTSAEQTETQSEDMNTEGALRTSQRRSTVTHAQLKERLTRQRALIPPALAAARAALPATSFQDEFCRTVRAHAVVIVAGETGSGKSTQMPQYLLEDALLCDPLSSSACNGTASLLPEIVCTQPRRVSALSIARRVSCELGDPHVGGLCGYQVRMESSRSAATALLYCTTGILLRRLQGDPDLTGVTHVVVDEVHERSIECDFILALLKKLLPRRPDLRVVLMSATLDAQRFSAYFHDCPVLSIEGRTFPVDIHYAPLVIEQSGYTLEPGSQYAEYNAGGPDMRAVVSVGRGGDQHAVTQDVYLTNVSQSRDEHGWSARTQRVLQLWDRSRINYDLLTEAVLLAVTRAPFTTEASQDGAVLVFLPGRREIELAHNHLMADRRLSDPSRFVIVQLHATLPYNEQQRAFDIPRAPLRKIVLSTNTAETGVTIPDVVCVVDTGRVKEMRFNEHTRMQRLLECFTSRASCNQRAGRAGRVRAGHCIRLFTEEDYHEMSKQGIPEIQRTPLEQLCLAVLMQRLGRPLDVLMTALDAPQASAVHAALEHLIAVGAVESVEAVETTVLGRNLAQLPVDVHTGKLLLLGALHGVGASVLSIAALGERPDNLFVSSASATKLCEKLRVRWSDHVASVYAFHSWLVLRQEQGVRVARQWCERVGVRVDTVEQARNVRVDMMRTLTSALGYAESLWTVTGDGMRGELEGGARMLRAVLAAALYPNVAVATTLEAPHKMEGRLAGQSIVVDRQSQLIEVGRWSDYTVAFDTLERQGNTKKNKGRLVARQCSCVPILAVVLLCGQPDDAVVYHGDGLLVIGRFIRVRVVAKTAVVLMSMRRAYGRQLRRRLDEPAGVHGESAMDVFVRELLK